MNLEKIEALVYNSEKLKHFISKINDYRRDRCHNDGIKQGSDDLGININMNYYSTRTTGMFISNELTGVDKNIIAEYFIKYLDIHRDEIVNGVSELMLEEAKLNKNKAIEELDARKEELMKLLND